jgi:hypothetical protein
MTKFTILSCIKYPFNLLIYLLTYHSLFQDYYIHFDVTNLVAFNFAFFLLI